MLKFELEESKNINWIYDLNFKLFNMSGFGILKNPKKWEQRLYSIYHITFHSTYLFFICLFMIDAYLVRKDKENLNINLCVTLLTTGSIIKIWTLMNKLNIVVEIQRKFKENFNLPFVGQEEAHKEILEQSARRFLKIVKVLYGMVIPGATIWVTFPLVDPSSKERKFCLPFPIVRDMSSPKFELIYAYHVLLLFHFVSNIMSNDMMIFGFLIRICAQFDILIYDISKIKNIYPKPEYEKLISHYKEGISDYKDSKNEGSYAEQIDAKFKSDKKLKNGKEWQKRETMKVISQNIVHHRCILQQLQDLQYAYGGQMFVQMTLGAVLLSVVAFDVILQSRKLNATLFQQLCFVGAVIVDIFVLCYYGTQIAEKSEQLAQALYDTPWHEMDPTIKKIICFMMAKSRKHPRFKARYVFKLDLETYLSLVKTSYNVIALLNETK